MYKWMYDWYVEEYKKEPINKIVNEVIALQNIECSDRAFANQCEAGMTIYNLNEFFDKVEELCNAKPEDNIPVMIKEIKECFDNAKSSYSYIRSGLREMNDNCRVSNEEKVINDRVAKAKTDGDSI